VQRHFADGSGDAPLFEVSFREVETQAGERPVRNQRAIVRLQASVEVEMLDPHVIVKVLEVPQVPRGRTGLCGAAGQLISMETWSL
jgi:hypothetical protein